MTDEPNTRPTPAERPMKSAPVLQATHNSGESDPVVRQDYAGAGTERPVPQSDDADLGDLTKHGMNCGWFDREVGCTCSLKWRQALGTERTMHRAWRKRAEEAEVAERPVAHVREALEQAKAFIVATHLAPAIQRFERVTVDEYRKAVIAKIDAALTARPSDAAVALKKRLLHAITTAQNDDYSKPMTTERDRHVIRQDTMRDVVEFLGSLALPPDERARVKAAVNFCEWLDGYFGGVKRRDELTAFEANSIRAKLYGEVYPPPPLTDDYQTKRKVT